LGYWLVVVAEVGAIAAGLVGLFTIEGVVVVGVSVAG